MSRRFHFRRDYEQDKGFTLIELMVVVLIIGILMAIAIPTFLSVTSSAKTNAAEADLTTALADQQIYFTVNSSVYGGAGAISPADPALKWTDMPAAGTALPDTGGNKVVYVDACPSAATTSCIKTTTPPEVILGAVGQDGKNYWMDVRSGLATYGISTAAFHFEPAINTIRFTSWKLAAAGAALSA